MAHHPNRQRGIAHLGLIILVIAVVAAIGGIGYVVMNKSKDGSSLTDSIAEKAADKALDTAIKAECTKVNDDDLCKFFTSWKVSKQYRMVSTNPDGSKHTFELDGDKTHFIMTGDMAYESITIGKATYTKAGDVWYKQVTKDASKDLAATAKPEFDEPAAEDDTTAAPEDKTQYHKAGKEACGNLQCFKYEIHNPDAADEKQYIWFDDKDYQLRKSRTESKDGANEQTYEYGNIRISEPSPVKELGPNQYIMPGSSEPVTMPSAESMMQE